MEVLFAVGATKEASGAKVNDRQTIGYYAIPAPQNGVVIVCSYKNSAHCHANPLYITSNIDRKRKKKLSTSLKEIRSCTNCYMTTDVNVDTYLVAYA